MKEAREKMNFNEVDIEELENQYDCNMLIPHLTKFIEEKKNHIVLNSAEYHKKKLLEKREKEMTLKKEKKFWTKMSKVLPNERMRMWKVSKD